MDNCEEVFFEGIGIFFLGVFLAEGVVHPSEVCGSPCVVGVGLEGGLCGCKCFVEFSGLAQLFYVVHFLGSAGITLRYVIM